MKVDIDRLRKDTKKFLLLNGLTQHQLADFVNMTANNVSVFLNSKQSLANHRVASFCKFINANVEDYIVEKEQE